jgi:AraC-like DNA-binding protein
MPVFHRSSHATDLDEAYDFLVAFNPGVRLDAGADVRHGMDVDGDERFSVMRLQFAGRLQTLNDVDDICVAVNTSSTIEWEYGDERGTADVPWMMRPGHPIRATVQPGTDEIAVMFDVDELAKVGTAAYGEDDYRPEFPDITPQTTEGAALLSSVMRYVREVARTPAFDAELVRANLYRLAAATLLSAYRQPGDTPLRARTARQRQQAYRVAVQFLEDFASLPITVDDAAQAAGVSTAELQSIFRGQSALGYSPRRHLTEVRLTAARADLQRAGASDSDLVAVIAHRWGFASMRVFTRGYLRAFGTLP